MKLTCIILTMGDRPGQLARAVRSTEPLRADGAQVIVIGNGVDPGPLPPDVTPLRLPANAGVAGGRNAGAAAARGDVLMFLDDDGWYPDAGAAGRRVARRFAADPALAVLAFRVAGPDGQPGGRWHVPRPGAADPARSAPATTFGGGACAVRRTAFEEAGGLPDEFFYLHEEIDLAWRLLDRGYRIEYDADLVMCHPAEPNSRHAGFWRLDGRNRVLLARRNLPWPLAALFVLNWLAVTAARQPSPAVLRAWLAGAAEGCRMSCGRRQPISAATAWRMTRLGRPPVI